MASSMSSRVCPAGHVSYMVPMRLLWWPGPDGHRQNFRAVSCGGGQQPRAAPASMHMCATAPSAILFRYSSLTCASTSAAWLCCWIGSTCANSTPIMRCWAAWACAMKGLLCAPALLCSTLAGSSSTALLLTTCSRHPD